MTNTLKIFTLLALTFLFSFPIQIEGRKVKTTVSVPKEAKKQSQQTGTIHIDSSNSDEEYSLRHLLIRGYDKPGNSDIESFFITNNTIGTIREIELEIEYLTSDSIQMHKRPITLTMEIPVGETRKGEIKSWDKQKSFHYIKSRDKRKSTIPYIVKFKLLGYRLIPAQSK